MLATSGLAQTTNTYHTNRVFQPITFSIPGVPTAFQVCDMVGQLTTVVGPTNVVTNSFYAVEYECMVASHGSATQAWAALAGGYPSNSIIHTNHLYDNVGWVKGVQTDFGKMGGYFWVLKNTVNFKTSPTNIWVSTNAVTNAIMKILVGSIGDYPPMTEDQSDTGPGIAEGLTNFPSGGTSEMWIAKADFTAYYDIGLPAVALVPVMTNVPINTSNIIFNLITNNFVTNGVAWSVTPTDSVTWTNSASNITINVGGLATSYIVRATANNNTNIYGEAVLNAIRVDIVETQIYAYANGANVTFHIATNCSPGIEWTIIPDGGPYVLNSDSSHAEIGPGLETSNFNVKAYHYFLTNICDTAQLNVIRMGVLQAGMDCADTNDWVSLKKNGADTYTNDTFSTNGDTVIVNPVWQDADMNETPDIDPADPVCFMPGTVPRIVQSKLYIYPSLGATSVAAMVKIEAEPTPTYGGITSLNFGPTNITLTSSNVTLPIMIATNNDTVGSVVNNFNYRMFWSISLDNGANWHAFQMTSQQVFVVKNRPLTNYCSSIDFWSLPYTWSDLAWTAKRMDWATLQGRGANTGDGMADQVAQTINGNPGFLLGTNYYFTNSFTQLDTPDPYEPTARVCSRGDCISLANLAATALRLIGTNARPGRAYCNNSNNVDVSSTWGWTRRDIHSVHTNWFLGFADNNFEGFFYYGDANPMASSNFPAKGWTVYPFNNVTMEAGKEKFLPSAIISNYPISQLQWQSVNKPDVEWVTNAISGVFVDQDPVVQHCTNWAVGADGQYPIAWDAASSNLTLNGGTPVNITYNGSYSLPCSNGSITIYGALIQLPDNNQTGTVSIVPARMQAPVP